MGSSDLTVSPREVRLIAALLAIPAGDALEGLREMAAVAPWLRPGLDELERTPLELWQAEHTRLFVNGYPRTPCPPFESAYRQGQMGGTVGPDLEALYRRAGLTASGAPPDYLGTLLDCLAYLLEREASAGLLEELRYEHLARWLPDFARDLQDSAELRLYRDLGARLVAAAGLGGMHV